MSAPRSADKVDVLAVMDRAANQARGIAKEFPGSQNLSSHAKEVVEARAAVAELIEAAERASTLLRLLTVRQVIEAGDDAIEAAGLNPYCINEGLAEGHERINFWRLDAAIETVGAAQ